MASPKSTRRSGLLKGRDGGGLALGAPATLFIRPERLRPAETGIAARVTDTAFEGHLTHVGLRASDGHRLNMSLGRDLGAHSLTPGGGDRRRLRSGRRDRAANSGLRGCR